MFTVNNKNTRTTSMIMLSSTLSSKYNRSMNSNSEAYLKDTTETREQCVKSVQS